MVDIAQPSRAPRVNKIAMASQTAPKRAILRSRQPSPLCLFPGATLAVSAVSNIDSRQRLRVAECRTPAVDSGASIP